jgi:hypothetical protein
MLMNDPYTIRRSFFNVPAMRRFSALALFAGASSLALHAQSATPADPRPVTALSGVSYSSSSSVDVPEGADHLDLPVASSDAMQPPPRRRYGRPRYNDSSHNPDGSPKYTFVAGVGFTAPVGNTYHYLNTQYGIQVGGGRNFNKNFAVLLQFDYDHFGMNGRTLYNELSLYNYGLNASSAYYVPTLDGNSHVWSFSLNPMYTFNMQGPIGAYVVGAVGFYHKVANFTTPENGYVYYYGFPEEVTENEVIDHYTSNAPGFNAGIGLTFKPSRFAGERLFVEGRYDLILNSQRFGLTAANINTTTGQNYYYADGTNYYPANSNRTTYTVFKAGIRF